MGVAVRVDGLMIAVVGVAAVAAYLWYKREAIAATADELVTVIGQSVDVTSDQNVAYRATSSVVQSVTGDDGATLGTWVYDLFHGE
jgi:hypothetical protein